MSDTGIEKYISAAMKRRILAGDTPQWMLTHVRGRYIIKATLSAPLWMHRRNLKELRELEAKMSAAFKERYVLDHIVPIDHPFVCGLTVPWNIRVIPHACNANKRNEWHPDQNEIDFHPQYQLF